MQLLARPCPNDLCRLASDGAYEHLIVGKLVHVASDEELKQVFTWAKAQQQWQSLPADFTPYQHSVVLVSIQTTDSAKPVSVFLTREEYEAAPFELGAMVRYRPHNQEYPAPENPEERTLFYGLTGCVATLCAVEDKACQARYLSGVFNLQGQAINFADNTLIDEKITINPDSLIPSKEAN